MRNDVHIVKVGPHQQDTVMYTDGVCRCICVGHHNNTNSYLKILDKGRIRKMTTKEIGNVQEEIFCLDNVDFQRNDNATDYNVKDDLEITTKNLDLIHIPTGVQVELKNPRGDKLYGNRGPKKAYYTHRDSGFRKFIREGNIMIINFMDIKKVVVVSKENFKDPKMGRPKGGVEIPERKEHIWDPNMKKYKDTITVTEDQLIDYDMMVNGNSEISDKISKIIKNRETR